MAGSVTVAANASSGNVLLGNQYELAPFDGTAEFLAFAAATGITVSVFSGPDILLQTGATIPFGAAAAAPTYPDHIIADDDVAEGDRLSLIFQNTTGAGIVVNWRVMLTPN